jgi:hypothetical protein
MMSQGCEECWSSNITTAPFSMLVFWLVLLFMPGLLRPNQIATKLKREVQVVFKVSKDKRYQFDSSFLTFGKVSYITCHATCGIVQYKQ